MTNSKWAFRLLKLGVITWLVANTGIFSGDWGDKKEESTLTAVEAQERDGLKKALEMDRKVNLYVLAKVDSVRSLVEAGHRYKMADYFHDLKSVYDYADKVAPWARHSFVLSNLQVLRDREEDLAWGETERLCCEIVGVCPKKVDPNEPGMGMWLLRQYLLGILPALILCLVLARQGRIKWNIRKSPASSLLYLALWPLNFLARLMEKGDEVRHEAELRVQKDSLFAKLSGLEEGFLERLRTRDGRKDRLAREVLGTSHVSLRYALAVVAVLIIRSLPSIATASNDSCESDIVIECASHDPPSAGHEDAVDDQRAIFTWGSLYEKVFRRLVWKPDRSGRLLVGFRTCLEHVPLGKMGLLRFV